MGNIFCKIFGHNKTYWNAGLGGTYTFCWCNCCGKDFDPVSIRFNNQTSAK